MIGLTDLPPWHPWQARRVLLVYGVYGIASARDRTTDFYKNKITVIAEGGTSSRGERDPPGAMYLQHLCSPSPVSRISSNTLYLPAGSSPAY
jgi:hypothetical protein